jgi:hypothetical protein
MLVYVSKKDESGNMIFEKQSPWIFEIYYLKHDFKIKPIVGDKRENLSHILKSNRGTILEHKERLTMSSNIKKD